MNENLESKMPNFIVANSVYGYTNVVSAWMHESDLRNSPLLPARTQVRGVSRDAEALRAIRALNLNILDFNLFRPDLIRGSLTDYRNRSYDWLSI